MITRIFTLTVVVLVSLAAISEACGRRGRGGCSGGGCSSGGCSGGGCSSGSCGSGFMFGGGGCGPGGCPGGGCSTGNCANGQCGYVGYLPTSYAPTMGAFAPIANTTCNISGCVCVGGNCPADCAANGCNCGMSGVTGTAEGGFIKVKVCDNLSCRIATVPVSSTPCQWKPVPGAPSQVAKYVGGIQVGCYDEQSMIFRPFNAATQTWGDAVSYASDAKAPPTKPGPTPTGQTTPATGATSPASTETQAKATGNVIGTVAGADLQDWQVKGIGWVPPKENTLWENGVKTLESKTMGAGSDVPDFSKRGRIVVVSNDAGKRKAIAKEIAASELGRNRDVQDFAPAAWQVKPFKLDQDAEFGRTDLCLLELGPVESDGRGRALHVEHSYGDVATFGRKIDPNFAMDSVPSSEKAGIGGDGTTLAVAAFILIGVGLAVFMPSKQEPVVAAANHPEGVSPWELT